MDDKVFNLIEKMYLEMQEMKSNMATKEDLLNMATKEDILNMATKEDISRIDRKLVAIEDKVDTNHKALYDGYKQSIEGINELRVKLDKLTDRVENQEIKLQVLRSVK